MKYHPRKSVGVSGGVPLTCLSPLIVWMRKKIKEAKAKGIVLGLSGGLDSTLTAVLCQQAMGKKMLGLILPCHSLPADIADARFVAKKFSLKTKTINLGPIYDLMIKMLPRADNLTRANLKSRLRMLTLYYFANKLNYLVVGTGNKSELLMGYFTKYGDGASDLLPLGNRCKTEVFSMAKEAGIPERILKKIPSAGLWKGQTDEKEMGITYKELDEIIFQLEKGRRIKGKKAERIKKMIKHSQHKRLFPPIFKER